MNSDAITVLNSALSIRGDRQHPAPVCAIACYSDIDSLVSFNGPDHASDRIGFVVIAGRYGVAVAHQMKNGSTIGARTIRYMADNFSDCLRAWIDGASRAGLPVSIVTAG